MMTDIVEQRLVLLDDIRALFAEIDVITAKIKDKQKALFKLVEIDPHKAGARLTAKQRKEILERSANGERQIDLARAFNVSIGAIYYLRKKNAKP
jgi:hypothetical protein